MHVTVCMGSRKWLGGSEILIFVRIIFWQKELAFPAFYNVTDVRRARLLLGSVNHLGI